VNSFGGLSLETGKNRINKLIWCLAEIVDLPFSLTLKEDQTYLVYLKPSLSGSPCLASEFPSTKLTAPFSIVEIYILLGEMAS
jgi:hypothetical protein